MTDNEIIKAFGSCPYQRDCVSCDIDSCNNSPNYIMKCALDLIIRQKAEIEDLNKDLADTIALNYEECKGLKAEIERLQEEYPFKCKVGYNSEIHSKSIQDYDNLIGDIGAEAIKEFAERCAIESWNRRFADAGAAGRRVAKMKLRAFLTCLPGSLYRTFKYIASIPFWRWFE